MTFECLPHVYIAGHFVAVLSRLFGFGQYPKVLSRLFGFASGPICLSTGRTISAPPNSISTPAYTQRISPHNRDTAPERKILWGCSHNANPLRILNFCNICPGCLDAVPAAGTIKMIKTVDPLPSRSPPPDPKPNSPPPEQVMDGRDARVRGTPYAPSCAEEHYYPYLVKAPKHAP